jgi:ArsR family transcriptional regulator
MPPATATRKKADKSEIPVLPIADRTLAGLTQVFKLLADESRLRILLTLAREGEMHVSALCQMLGQSQPAVSHHLTLLRMAGLVGFRRDGKFNYYRLDALSLGDLLDKLFAESGRGASMNFGEFSLTYSRGSGRRR